MQEVVYQATLTTAESTETYVSLTATATRLAKMVKEAQIHRERMLDVSSIHDIAFCS